MAKIFGGMEKLGKEVGTEIKRLGIQGTMELASALFNGHAFVPYGPGQYTPKSPPTPAIQGQEVAEPQREIDGRGI